MKKTIKKYNFYSIEKKNGEPLINNIVGLLEVEDGRLIIVEKYKKA